jgi:hypothetical protein
VNTDIFSLLLLDSDGRFRVVSWEGEELELTARGTMSSFTSMRLNSAESP